MPTTMLVANPDVRTATRRTRCLAAAQAKVNCRHPPRPLSGRGRKDLIRHFADPPSRRLHQTTPEEALGKGSEPRCCRASPPLNDAKQSVFKPTATKQSTPCGKAAHILPEMETGASDSIYTIAPGPAPESAGNGHRRRRRTRPRQRDERLGSNPITPCVEFPIPLP